MGMLATRCVVGVKPHGQVYRNGFERQRENSSGNPPDALPNLQRSQNRLISPYCKYHIWKKIGPITIQRTFGVMAIKIPSFQVYSFSQEL